MDILSIIAGIFDLYYSKRIAKDERNLLLKERVTSEMFDTAVRLLLNRKEIEITQDVILTGFLLNYFSMSNENPMRSLLLEDFHNSHEDIVSLFQTLWNESIENIPVLLKAYTEETNKSLHSDFDSTTIHNDEKRNKDRRRFR